MTTMALKMKMKIQQDQLELLPLQLTVRESQLHQTPLLLLTMGHPLSQPMKHFALPVRSRHPLKKHLFVSPITHIIQTLIHKRPLLRYTVQQDLTETMDTDSVPIKQKELGT